MGISGAVDWWEEWQLRILVLGSLLVQWLLFLSAHQRKREIPSLFRFLIWLTYLGSDALAIYALANLFGRQRRQDCSSGQGNSILEVVWAPVLLMHLGGQDGITAYNIEDNELWTRHALTAVSQITVAIYVFCKSWPGGDKRLLQVAILLFTPGILKCLVKPWALKRASINSLVFSYNHRRKTASKLGKISLEEYVKEARDFVQGQGEGDAVGFEPNHGSQAEGKGDAMDLEANQLREAKRDGDELELPEKSTLNTDPYRLFVDRASSYSDRLSILQMLWVLDDRGAYDLVREGLSETFDLLYTKKKMRFEASEDVKALAGYIRFAAVILPWAAIGLFHKSHREAYNVNDVKVTYALFCCTAVLEVLSTDEDGRFTMGAQLSVMVAQYSLISFFVRNKRHSKKMCILSSLNCKDFLDQRWCMKSCSSSFRITKLVLTHVKGRWKDIVDAASYMRFNDHRGQWTIHRRGCNQDLGWSLNRPFDESVLLWHIATDLCFYQKGDTSASHENATRCREISNYMVYLLFVNPEMLLPGMNRNLFKNANDELKKILKDDKPLLELLKRKGSSTEEIEKGLVDRIVELQPMGCREENPDCTELPPDGDRHPTAQDGFVHNAKLQLTEPKDEGPGCTKSPTDAEQNPTQQVFIQGAIKISKALLDLGDDTKMWEVIEGVWVEMLCFSASRCRGYLHAKSLGTGGELLTYIWLLLSYMGMETLPERLQRTDLSSGGGNSGTTSSTSQTSGSEDPQPHEAAAAHASTSRPEEILPAEWSEKSTGLV